VTHALHPDSGGSEFHSVPGLTIAQSEKSQNGRPQIDVTNLSAGNYSRLHLPRPYEQERNSDLRVVELMHVDDEVVISKPFAVIRGGVSLPLTRTRRGGLA